MKKKTILCIVLVALLFTQIPALAADDSGGNGKAVSVNDNWSEVTTPAVLTNEFTFETWIWTEYFDNFYSEQRHIFAHSSYGSGIDFELGLTGGYFVNEGYAAGLQLWYWDNPPGTNGNPMDMLANIRVQVETWTHIAVTGDGQFIRIFVNGTLAGTQQYTQLIIPDRDTMNWGSYCYSCNTGLDGYLDEIRVSDIARYTEDFVPTYQKFHTDENTVMLLHFNNLQDASKNGNHPTLGSAYIEKVSPIKNIQKNTTIFHFMSIPNY